MASGVRCGEKIRGASVASCVHDAAMADAATPRGWEYMRQDSAERLRRSTGADVAEWNERIAASGVTDEPALRAWLSERGVTGYPQMLLVMERFGYPDFLLASPDELIDGQYADRPQLRPILDAVLVTASNLGEVTVQARKSYVSLVTPRRTFAQVKASTRSRVDLGLRLDGQRPHGRLQPAGSLGNGACTVRIGLNSVADVDDEVQVWLRQAYDANR